MKKYSFTKLSILRKTGQLSSLAILMLAMSSEVRAFSFVKSPIRVIINSPDQLITGKVTGDKGEELPGVSVRVKGSQQGTTTSPTGEFELSVPENSVLVFSFIGYKTLEVPAAQGQLIVKLLPDQEQLNEVVVVGYGSQKKVNVTGSVTSLDQKVLANRPITNSTQALQNLPGVFTNQTKGRPGADAATIRIRGVGTLNNSNPLVLVDGVEFPLGDVNPNDIESITVLKDAASAAIYGNRAANGVILVKTKSGQKGTFRVDYNFYVGKQKATQFPDVVTNSIEYMEGKNRALANEGKPAESTPALLEEYRNGTDPYIYPNTNWFDLMFRSAPIQEHNLRLSGGSEKTAFSVSLGYLNQQGILIQTSGKRYSLNTNVSADISKKVKIGASLIGNFWINQESAYSADEGNGEGGLMGLIYRGLPMQTPYAPNGTYADQWIRVPGHNFFRNPVALSKEGFRKNNQYRTLANLFLEYQLPFNIRYKTTIATNILFGVEKYSYPQINLTNPKTGVISPIGNTPLRGIRQISQNNINLTNFHTLNWEQTFNQHTLTALAGFSVEKFNDGNFSAYNQGYLGNDLTELNAGSTAPQVTGTSGQSRLLSYFGRINYNYAEKYLLEANFRYDGSSRFAPGNRWGFFPSFSAGWRLSEEEFLKNNPFVSNLKLRGSYGRLGNQLIPLFSYVDAISLGQGYNFNNTLVSGAAITQLSDPNITWETTTMLDFGLEGGFFENRLSFEIDWFDKKTSNILRQVAIPAQVGNLDGPFRNIGAVTNQGVEVNIGFRNSIQQFRYSVDANVTFLKNEVTDLDGQVYYNGNTITQEGSAISAFYGLEAEGIFQNKDEIQNHAFQNAGTQPGDLKYRDIDGNKVIDNNDRVVIGNSIPQYTYGFNLSARYKDLELSAIFQGLANVDTYLTGNLAQPYKNGAGVTREWLTNSWTPENPTAKLPRLTTSNGYPQNYLTSSFWIKDASYLRLKNIQLSYNLPKTLYTKGGITQFKLFVNAQNYVTFTQFKFSDPERNLTRGDLIEYPNAKSFTAGLNVSF
ncbi:SusC/RagA family TonB-linked outer membrane protein [Adhaeribacter pallidiroseus]|uniref:TonB-dependent receptor SusC n=1 Tax=Adhaeribacter pallidiroseus TaxID=2072847 RepID=A0A369QJ34_9BACT|nr:TonB-dependent receptor [Adhaeribacter pallidiroseus]RDC63615.1 TonB-dependent receptor SusC [Adhaeribacter pallidiroseus]